MSRRTGVVNGPDQYGVRKSKTTTRANLSMRAARRNKGRASSEYSDSSQSLFHIDDAAAFRVALIEGDTFKNTGQFRRAIQSYTRALEKQPAHRGALLARSQCYQQVGDNRRALADANKALQEDQLFIKGLLQKAECYYSTGEFEYALVEYHRGHRIRPEIQAFRLGIQKSQAAIENCIGDSAAICLTKDGDLTFFADEQKPDASSRREAELASTNVDESRDNSKSQRGRVTLGGRKHPTDKQGSMDQKTVKQLLGELYADKQYLESLLTETEKSSKLKSREAVLGLTSTCLDYLDTRTEFWSQQQPKESDWTQLQLRDIEKALSSKKYKNAAAKCSTILSQFEGRRTGKFGEFIALVHSLNGSAHQKLGEREQALAHHRKDLQLSQEINSAEGISRANNNIVKIHLKNKEFAEAAQVFEEMLKPSSATLEKAWLYHEIGKCNFELSHYSKASECGYKSLSAAKEASDLVWQLNANVLVAQASYQLEDYQSTLSSYNAAYVIAERLNDRAAEKAIKEAISRVQESIPGQSRQELSRQQHTNSSEEQKKSREEQTRSREEQTESREEQTRSREEQTRSREEQTMSREEQTESREEQTKSREEQTKSREEQTKSREEQTRSREEKTRSREEQTKSREEQTKSREEQTKSRESSNRENTASREAETSKINDSKQTEEFKEKYERENEKEKYFERNQKEVEDSKDEIDAKEVSADSRKISSRESIKATENNIITETEREVDDRDKEEIKITEERIISDGKETEKEKNISKSDLQASAVIQESENVDDIDETEEIHTENKTFITETVEGPKDIRGTTDENDVEETNKAVALEDDEQLVEKKDKTQASASKNTDQHNVAYEVTVRISDVEGAGTDQDIYVQLTGEQGVSRRELLDRPTTSSGSAFERGMSYKCDLNVLDVGKITKLTIGHSGADPGAGCHIDDVTVEARRGEGSTIYKFSCRQWLDRGQGDRLIERDLMPDNL